VSVNNRVVTAGVLIATFAVVVASGVVRRMSPDALNRSVDSLLTTRLNLTYRIEKQVLEPMETDQQGLWWIVMDGPSTSRVDIFHRAGIEPADAADTAYYTQMFQEQLAPSISLEGYQLFRGEMPLGAGSICEELECDIAILAQANGPNALVLISKN
jgi:hypothetical protein